jgi:type II secretory pathway predicted ATPase ExeA
VNNKMLALYGLKWNPFTPNVPTEALHVTTRLQSFCWRVQQLAGDGGFALVTGAPGCGKSAALRILTASLATQRDVTVGLVDHRPTSPTFIARWANCSVSSYARITATAVPRSCANAGRLTSKAP